MSISRAALTTALAALLVVTCKPKSPVIVSLTGPTSGPTGDTLAFQVKGEDPQGRDLSYEMDWGDTSSLAWTAPYPSGKQVTLPHVYNDTGLFHVRAKTRSGPDAESEWSDSVVVQLWVVPPAKPVVSIIPKDTGAVLGLNWHPVLRADNYRVTVDDSTTQTTDTFYDVRRPARQISVCAFHGTTQGEESYVDCTPVVSEVKVYCKSDPDTSHPRAFGFTTNGTCTTYTLDDENKPHIDFVVDDVNLIPIGLVNAGDYGWPQNSKANTSKELSSSDFDEFDFAVIPGGYTTQMVIGTNRLYALWLSSSANWTPNDHFCKMKVTSIVGTGGSYEVTLKVGYQKVGGMRWLRTN